MNYNLEDIQQIAAAVAKLVQAGISQKQIENQERQTMAGFELAFREAVRQIGGAALGIFLSELQQTPESEIKWVCGGKPHYHRLRSGVTPTVCGKVTYRRAYYAGCPLWSRPGSTRPDLWLGSGCDQFRLGATDRFSRNCIFVQGKRAMTERVSVI